MAVLMEKNRFLHPAESCYTQGKHRLSFIMPNKSLNDDIWVPLAFNRLQKFGKMVLSWMYIDLGTRGVVWPRASLAPAGRQR